MRVTSVLDNYNSDMNLTVKGNPVLIQWVALIDFYESIVLF